MKNAIYINIIRRSVIMEKTCFVIMGFETKKIPNTNIRVNLDDTYNYLIKPVLVDSGLISVFQTESNAYRCDEIFTTQAINETFIRNLYIADIVVADITALNQNAIYELGMRHAMKPKSTIIMCDNKTLENNTFFDLTFNPHLTYDSNLQKDINEINRVKHNLSKIIETCKNSGDDYIDSPVFSYGIYKNSITNLHESKSSQKNSLRELIEKADSLLEDELYADAEVIYQKILNDCKYTDNDVVCSYILSMYRKDLSIDNLLSSLKFLETYIDLETTTCENALGIAASINLKLFALTKEPVYLYLSMEYYRKGSYYESGNLYCAKNYCSTLLKAYQIETSISVLKEYYYTAVHNAKYFLSHSQTIDRESTQYNNAWFMSNQNDLFLIAFDSENGPYRVTYKSLRQKNTIENGRKILREDLKMLKDKIF